MAHIVRIDKRNTHGYQARWSLGQGSRYGSKMFSDSKYGGAKQARAAAEQFLADNPELDRPAPANVPPYRDKLLAHNVSGVTGVCRTYQYHGQTGQKQEYWAAFVSTGPAGRPYTRKFYISDEQDEEEAYRLAVEFRQMWEEAADAGQPAIRKFFEEYESGWL